ncbi:MAG TPA: radical SAM family heme chaperone HemW [Chloroflexota bacterium]
MATQPVRSRPGHLMLGEDLVGDGPVRAAVYVHFPFCRHMCTYCDFDTFTGMEALIDSYVAAAESQILAMPECSASSLYVGGGTPSIMNPEQAGRLIQAGKQRLGLSDEAEVTIEANPTDMDERRLAGFRSAGYNRLSVGVQSADPRLLRLLGRRHSSEDAARAVATARSAGFHNISVDLIYGVPKQSLRMWRETLEEVVGWGVEHLSCYMLTVEPGTPMERGVQRGTLVVPPDEEVVAMYSHAVEWLGSRGFRRYEISNWALPGRESRHNLTYWRNQPYLAIGAGAAGYVRGVRYKIQPRIGAYVAGVRDGKVPLSEWEEEDKHRRMSETLSLGLRLDEGVSLPAFVAEYGQPPEEEFGRSIEWGLAGGLLVRDKERLRLTERGILFSNELFERLL